MSTVSALLEAAYTTFLLYITSSPNTRFQSSFRRSLKRTKVHQLYRSGCALYVLLGWLGNRAQYAHVEAIKIILGVHAGGIVNELV